MLIDARSVSKDDVISTHVCIVGAGPAGITLAKEFMGKDFQVTILESGDIEPDDDTLSLRDAASDNDPEFYPFYQRQRQVVGTANNWGVEVSADKIGVRYAPFDPLDFEEQEWLPHSGWPISRAELNPFYERAHALCGLGKMDYTPETWDTEGDQTLSFKGNTVKTNIFQFGLKETFTKTYKKEISETSEIKTYVNANVIDIEMGEESQTISRVKVATLSGNTFWVEAKIFILATGALENARMLLLSNKQQKNGLGNQHDVVGRYFIDHFMVYGGVLAPQDPKVFNHVNLYDLHWVNGTPIMGKLSLSSQVRQQEQLLNASTYLLPCHSTYMLRVRGMQSREALATALKQGKLPQNALGHLGNMAAGMKHMANALHRKLVVKKPFYFSSIRTGGWSKYPNKDKEFALFEIQHLIEQAPHPDNRVLLSDERDRLGCRKMKIELQFRDIDARSINRTQDILRDEFAKSGIGTFRIERDEDQPKLLNRVTGSSHHMGTTRMSEDPKTGVVDANGQVHGIPNLFVAGSSVFPTGSYANPTLTLIATSIRLADHINAKMA